MKRDMDLVRSILIAAEKSDGPLDVLKLCESGISFDYQSECHCSKTGLWLLTILEVFDYQSECHCSKTHHCPDKHTRAFDYQSECHCSKTLR